MVIWIVIAAIIGIVVGCLIGFSLAKKIGRPTSLESELDTAKEELHEYHIRASSHLRKTNEILENIFQQCNKLQEHTYLASTQLNKDDSLQSVLQPVTYIVSQDADKSKKASAPSDSPDLEPPKDYAGK